MLNNLTIGERIKLLRSKNNLSQQSVADACNVSRGLIAQIESGNTNPNLPILSVLVRLFNTTFEYLIEGYQGDSQSQKQQGNMQGNMQGLGDGQNETPQKNKSKEYSISQNETPQFQEPKTEYVTVINDSEGFELIPMLEIKAAAGSGYINPDKYDQEAVLRLPSAMLKGKSHICIRIKGDSMAPTLHDSGYLVIRQLERTEWQFMPDGRVYVVSDNDNQVYLKRIKPRFEKGFIVLTSDNPDKASHPNFNLTIEEIATIWYVEWYFTAKMPNIHDNFYSKVSTVEEGLEMLTQEVESLKKKIDQKPH